MSAVQDPMRAKVRSAFSRASDYDGNAVVQREIATGLAKRIASLDLPPSPKVLEIGCGTGFLTQALMDTGMRGQWLVTDIAPPMLERCEARLSALSHQPSSTPSIQFDILDGEHGQPDNAPFDLICSSLAMQWFDDTPAALSRLVKQLRPGGHLIITTLGPDSFHEWQSAHQIEGLTAGTPKFAPFSGFENLPFAHCSIEKHVETHASANAFLRSLKAIGAGTSASDHHPLSPSQLRRVMARFTELGCRVTYDVITCHIQATQD